jgi:kumamolisin
LSGTDRVPLEASQPRHGLAGLRNYTDPIPSQNVDATIVVRRRPDPGTEPRIAAILRGEAPPMSREDAAQFLHADPLDLEKVAAFAASYGLTVTESSQAKRTAKVSGTVTQMEAAFGVKLRACEIAGKGYLCYDGALTIPVSLEGIIVGVLGLDQRPVART